MLKKKFNGLSDLNKTILKSSFWILIGTIISKGMLLLSSIYIVNYIDKDLVGKFGIIRSTVNMFSVFAGMGLGLTATKYISQHKNNDPKRTSSIIGMSNFFSIVICFFVSLLFWIFSKKLAVQLNSVELEDSLKLSSFVILFSGLNGIQNGILAGFERFKLISINSIWASLISSIVQIIGAKFYGLNGVIVGFGLNFIILYLINIISINKIIKNKYEYKIFNKNTFKDLRILWRFSLPAVLSGLMISPIVWITNVILIDSKDGYLFMADFDIANQWRNAILFIPSALSQIALPMMSANKFDFKLILYKNLKINFIVSSIFVVILIALSPIIISFYGEEYSNARIPLIVMLITTVLMSVNNIVGNAITSLDKMWFGFLSNFLWGFVLIIFSFIFIKIYSLGAVGLSIAYLLSYTSHTVVQYFILKYITKTR